ncbi:MAG: hypothetical protein LAT64_07505 [Phycisphaerales bacterium]|nr:hypothetical protein [Planctomycetota bacterium]MCH8508602.1 hypothetical protein [Phycisphaerales bacterium]
MTRPLNPLRSTPIARLAALLLAAVIALPGCVAAVPLVSAASAGAAAGEAGFTIWRSGMLTYVDEGTVDQMNQAVALTIDRLGLTIRHTLDDEFEGELLSRWWSVRSDRGHLVTIEVHPLTSALVEVKINAGPFGNRAAAELIADRLKNELDTIQATQAPGVMLVPTPGS